jgi:hypothetical protein
MPESNQSIESRIQLAILELENVEKPNIKAWALSQPTVPAAPCALQGPPIAL